MSALNGRGVKSRRKGLQSMLVVTESASMELKKALNSEMAKNKHLLLYFQGAG